MESSGNDNSFGASISRTDYSTADLSVAGHDPDNLQTSKHSSHSMEPDPLKIGEKDAGNSAANGAGATASAEYAYGSMNVAEQIMLRVEFAQRGELKAVLNGVQLFITMGIVSLLYLSVVKVTKDSNYFLRNYRPLAICNSVVASINILWLGTTITTLVVKFMVGRRKKLKWAVRRRHFVSLLFFELCVQWVNSAAYLIPNVYILASDCGWTSSVMRAMGTTRWICWSTIWTTSLIHGHYSMPLKRVKLDDHSRVRHYISTALDWLVIRRGWEQRVRTKGLPESIALVIDLPYWVHAPKLIFWIACASLSVLMSTWADTGVSVEVPPPVGSGSVASPASTGVTCGSSYYACTASNNRAVVISAIVLGLFILQGVVLVLVLLEAKEQLRGKPYVQFRMANIAVRVMMRNRMAVFSFIAVTVALLWFVEIRSCNTMMFGWFGFLPMQLTCSAFLCLSSFSYMPINHRPGLQNQMLLQECVWGEDRKQAMVEHYCEEGETLFCFETMLKLYYWSYLVYDYKQAESSLYTADFAMQLYGLENFELLWDKNKDTKGILGWGPHAIVLAFRGTASAENVITDAQFWQAAHPPLRGKRLLGTRPRVHGGFLTAWQANDYNKMVLTRINEILESSGAYPETCPIIYVTGHSLGGALACLAAIEISRGLEERWRGRVVCYTFGAPRVGNMAFAKDVNHLVPDMWHVVNDQDLVTRAGKLFGMYKRSNKRTMIFPNGNIVIRPSFVEVTVYKSILNQGSVSQHLLTSYLDTIREVMLGQYLPSGNHSAREGIRHMLSSNTTAQFVRNYVGLDTDQMLEDSSNGRRSRRSLVLRKDCGTQESAESSVKFGC